MPARHESLQDSLLRKGRSGQAALVDERGCRRDIRSNGWIEFSNIVGSKTGPAEETSFLRSVRISKVRNFAGGPKPPHAKSGPDVFADALVPRRDALVP
jgi:hypothetical protein